MNAKILIFTCFLFCSCSLFKSSGEISLPDSLEDAVDASSRSEEHSDRDEYQHPLETLTFFGIKPDMTVVEVTPGAGYFTEILAPYLAKQGEYAIVVPRMPPNAPAFMRSNEKKIQSILLAHRDIQAKTSFIPFEPMNKRSKTRREFADMVLSFNNVHNWVATRTEAFSFKFFYDLLKPGGVLGLVQHRIPEGKKNFPKSGYMTEKEVIALAVKAGFKLVGRSDINANPKDTADYPTGVWTLPPFYRLGNKDRDKYEDIGESDRMTLKFMK